MAGAVRAVFIGGSKHGEIIDVPSDQRTWVIPVEMSLLAVALRGGDQPVDLQFARNEVYYFTPYYIEGLGRIAVFLNEDLWGWPTSPRRASGAVFQTLLKPEYLEVVR